MSGKEQSDSGTPLAPPDENSSLSNITDQSTSPVLYQQPAVQPVLLGPQSSVRCGVELPPYRLILLYDAFFMLN